MAEDLGASRGIAAAIDALGRDINDKGHGERLVPELVTLLGERKG
jgi:hypothetical protein